MAALVFTEFQSSQIVVSVEECGIAPPSPVEAVGATTPEIVASQNLCPGQLDDRADASVRGPDTAPILPSAGQGGKFDLLAHAASTAAVLPGCTCILCVERAKLDSGTGPVKTGPRLDPGSSTRDGSGATYLELDWAEALAKPRTERHVRGYAPDAMVVSDDDVRAAVDALGEARRALLVIAAGEPGAVSIAMGAVRRVVSLLGGVDPL